jgi:hypothetical protein
MITNARSVWLLARAEAPRPSLGGRSRLLGVGSGNDVGAERRLVCNLARNAAVFAKFRRHGVC